MTTKNASKYFQMSLIVIGGAKSLKLRTTGLDFTVHMKKTQVHLLHITPSLRSEG